MNQRKKHDPVTPGKQLRRGREKKGWSVEEVGRRLKLSVSTIKSLEQDECSQTASVYRRGYLIAYARLLGLDLDNFSQCIGSHEEPLPPLQPALKTAPAGQNAERFLRFATYALGTAVVAVPLVWSLTEGTANFFSSGGSLTGPPLTNSQPTGADETSDSSEDGRAIMQPVASQPSHLSASVAPISALGHRTAMPINNEPLPSSVENQTADAEQAQAVELDVPADDSMAPEAAIPSPLIPSLRLGMQSDSWVEITDSQGQRLEYDLLRGGRSYQYDGEAPFRILIGRALGVDLEFQGQAVDLAPYIRGNVASFELGDQTVNSMPDEG